MQMKLVEKRITQLEGLGYQPQDFSKIKRVGEKMNFDATYTRNLGRLVNECYKGNVIKDTELYLEKGEKKYMELHPEGIEEGGFKRLDTFKEDDVQLWSPLMDAADALQSNLKRQKQEREEKHKRKGKGKNRSI
jgi:hypothetical protein